MIYSTFFLLILVLVFNIRAASSTDIRPTIHHNGVGMVGGESPIVTIAFLIVGRQKRRIRRNRRCSKRVQNNPGLLVKVQRSPRNPILVSSNTCQEKIFPSINYTCSHPPIRILYSFSDRTKQKP